MREERIVKNIDKNELFNILEKIKNDPNSVKNIVYNYNGILIYIKNKKPSTVKERYKKLYRGRRDKGLCIKCLKPTNINPKINKPYRLCEEHRVEELRIKKEERRILREQRKKKS